MELPSNLDQLNPQQLRDLTASLIQTVNQQAELLKSRQLKIDRLTHEMATLKRWRFARRSPLWRRPWPRFAGCIQHGP